jgi:hypothetical protein
MRVAKAPENVSPAPVVSTADTPGGDGKASSSAPGSSSSRAPSEPRTGAPDERGRGAPLVSPTGQLASLTRVGCEDRPEGRELDRRRASRRRVDDHGNPAPAPRVHGGADSLVRDLQADEHTSSTIQGSLQRAPNRIGPKGGVGAGSDGDLIVAAVIDHDERSARRLVGHFAHPVDVDPLAAQLRERLPSQVIAAHGGDEPGLGAQSCRRDRRVGPLAAAVPFEAAAQHCLAAPRQPLGGYHQVDVDRPDDDDDCV